MRIVFLQDDFPPNSLGGAGNVAFMLAKALQIRGHEVTIITATQSKEREGLSRYEGLSVYKIYANVPERLRAYWGLYNAHAVRRISALLAELCPEVVHAHNVHQHLSWAAIGEAKRSGAKVFYTAHDAMALIQGKAPKGGSVSGWVQLRKYRLRYNPFRGRLIRYYLRGVHITCVSKALADVLRKHGYSPAVLHNGIDASSWMIEPQSIETFRRAQGLESKKVVLFGGRLSAAKGSVCAIHALHELIRKVPEAVLLVLGRQDAYADSMQALAGELGVKEQVRFAGWLSGEELKAAYHAADVVAVLSTYIDPFPTTNLEAMACRKPVVGTRFGGTPEAVLDGITGYIVDPNDTEMVANKISELLLDDLRAKHFGAAGYERVVDVFSAAHWVDAYLEAYTK